jgi:hypothetical protein
MRLSGRSLGAPSGPDARAIRRSGCRSLGLDLLPALVGLDRVDHHGSGLSADDGRVRWVFKPVALPQPVDRAPAEIGHLAGDTFDLGISNGLDHDVIAGPVCSDLTNLLRPPLASLGPEPPRGPVCARPSYNPVPWFVEGTPEPTPRSLPTVGSALSHRVARALRRPVCCRWRRLESA